MFRNTCNQYNSGNIVYDNVIFRVSVSFLINFIVIPQIIKILPFPLKT